MSEDKSFLSGFKDFIGGTAGGMSQVMAGQPFDIIKVRMASSTEKVSALEMTRQVIANEGILAFWKGSLPPLMGVGLCVSIQFGVNENMKRIVLARKDSNELSTLEGCFCGGVAGVSNSVVAAPAEGMRIKMQVQGKVDPRGDPFYNSSIDCIKKVYSSHGLGGIYRGLLITMLREGCTFSTYFGAYEYMVRQIKPPGGRVEDIPAWKLLICGGLSGYFYWGPWYPIDIIKSKLQADSLANPRYKNSFDCARQILQAEGIGGFYRGFIPCILRAFPANAATFLAFEMTMRTIGRD